MNIIFMGTPNFAVPSLEALIKNKFNVIATLTQPDKPKGRGYSLFSPPVKILSNSYNIPVYQPDNIKSDCAFTKIKELSPDLIIVVAYGKILPDTILEIPKYGCINLHASLLPKYRGAAPIQWSILNGDKITGVTTMYMDKGLDTGDIIMQEQIKINDDETSSELHDRISLFGAEILVKTIKNVENKIINRVPQNHELATYTTMLSKDMSNINFSKTVDEVYNHIMGLSSWPCASTNFNKKRLKIYRAKKNYLYKDTIPGKLLDNKKFIISCLDFSIEITQVQYDGSKKMSGEDFLRGRKIEEGYIFN